MNPPPSDLTSSVVTYDCLLPLSTFFVPSLDSVYIPCSLHEDPSLLLGLVLYRYILDTVTLPKVTSRD